VTMLLWPLRHKPGVLSSSQSSNHRNTCPVPSSSMSSMSSSGGTSDVLITPPRTTIAQSTNWDLSTAVKPPNLSRISKQFHIHSSLLLKSPLMNKFNQGKVSSFIYLYNQSSTDYMIICRLGPMRGCGWLQNNIELTSEPPLPKPSGSN